MGSPYKEEVFQLKQLFKQSVQIYPDDPNTWGIVATDQNKNFMRKIIKDLLDSPASTVEKHYDEKDGSTEITYTFYDPIEYIEKNKMRCCVIWITYNKDIINPKEYFTLELRGSIEFANIVTRPSWNKRKQERGKKNEN